MIYRLGVIIAAGLVGFASAAENECKEGVTDPQQQLALGFKYAEGTGVDRSDRKARLCFEAAAEAGLASAQLELALYHMQGKGGPGEGLKALEWLDRAAAGGSEPAIKLRDELGGGLASTGELRRLVIPSRNDIKVFPYVTIVLVVWLWLAIGNGSPWPWKWNGNLPQDNR
jgi:TPR repeat protein